MYRNAIAICFLAGLLLLTGCQSGGDGAGRNSGPRQYQTIEGFPYVIHTSVDGAPGNATDHLFFHVYWRKGDELVRSTRTMGRGDLRHMQMPSDFSNATSIDQVIMSLAEGDSATVTVPLDQPDRIPEGFAGESEMLVDIAMVDIQTHVEFMQAENERTQQMEKLKEDLSAQQEEVADRLANTARQYLAGDLDGQIQTSVSGLKYIIHDQGSGEKPNRGQRVYVNFSGALTNGQIFDNSYERGLPFGFVLGANSVVRGWDEGISMLNKGGQATFFIPPKLGYGATGNDKVPPNSEMIFFVELFDIQ